MTLKKDSTDNCRDYSIQKKAYGSFFMKQIRVVPYACVAPMIQTPVRMIRTLSSQVVWRPEFLLPSGRSCYMEKA